MGSCLFVICHHIVRSSTINFLFKFRTHFRPFLEVPVKRSGVRWYLDISTYSMVHLNEIIINTKDDQRIH